MNQPSETKALFVAEEVRAHPRYKLVDRALPGPLFLVGRADAVMARAMDVSKSGLGIMCGEILVKSSRLELLVDELLVPLEVMWASGEAGRHRIGLRVVDAKIDLEEIFFARNLIDADFG